MQVPCDEGVAIHIGPESCAVAREGLSEALTGERIGQPLSRESFLFWVPTPCRSWKATRLGASSRAFGRPGVVRDPGMCRRSLRGNRKPTNKVVSATAEPVEPRAGAKGNASQQSTLRTQCRKCVSQALERIRQVRRHSPKVGAVCGNSARTDLGGGRSVMTVPTALRREYFAFPPQRTSAIIQPPAAI